MTDAEKIKALRVSLVALKEAAEDAIYYRKQGTDERFYAEMVALEVIADEAQTTIEETG